MAILIINSFAEPKDVSSVHAVSNRIDDLINRARFLKTPIAHVHQKRPKRASGLRVPVGRFEPIFQASDLPDGLPDELIDFVLNSSSHTIKLVGAASRDQFKRLSRLFGAAGLSAQIESGTIVETRSCIS